MFTKVKAAIPYRNCASEILVEVQMTTGIGIHLVGLADHFLKETLLRVLTALDSLGYHIPGKKIIINIAPSLNGMDSSALDLPIAIGILAESGQCPQANLNKYILAGELGLDGSIRTIRNAKGIAEIAEQTGNSCILPLESVLDWKPDLPNSVYVVSNLTDVLRILHANDNFSDLLLKNVKSRLAD